MSDSDSPFEAVRVSVPCMLCVCVFPGASEPSRELRCAEALGGAPVLPTGQPEVQSHPGAAVAGLLLQSRRDAARVRPWTDAVMSLLYNNNNTFHFYSTFPNAQRRFPYIYNRRHRSKNVQDHGMGLK